MHRWRRRCPCLRACQFDPSCPRGLARRAVPPARCSRAPPSSLCVCVCVCVSITRVSHHERHLERGGERESEREREREIDQKKTTPHTCPPHAFTHLPTWRNTSYLPHTQHIHTDAPGRPLRPGSPFTPCKPGRPLGPGSPSPPGGPISPGLPITCVYVCVSSPVFVCVCVCVCGLQLQQKSLCVRRYYFSPVRYLSVFFSFSGTHTPSPSLACRFMRTFELIPYMPASPLVPEVPGNPAGPGGLQASQHRFRIGVETGRIALLVCVLRV